MQLNSRRHVNYRTDPLARPAVVLAALDDAIADDKKYGNGLEVIARWARSRDGREVLMCAGIDPNERTVKGMMDFVRRGVRTSVALSREESERQAQRFEAARSRPVASRGLRLWRASCFSEGRTPFRVSVKLRNRPGRMSVPTGVSECVAAVAGRPATVAVGRRRP